MILMSVVGGVTSDPDTVLGDVDLIVVCKWAASPLEVEDIICNVVPVLSGILGVIEFFVDTARLIQEFGAGSPGSSQSP